MADDATPFLHHAREEAGNVFDGQQGEVERVAGANEPSGFDGRIDVQTTGEHLRLVGDDAHGATAKAGEADDDVLRVSVEELDKASVVDDRFDDLHHVVRLVRVVRDDGFQIFRQPIGRIRGLFERWRGIVVVGKEGQQVGRNGTCIVFVVGHEAGDAAP